MEISRDITIIVNEKEANVIFQSLCRFDGPYLPDAQLTLEEANRKFAMIKLAQGMAAQFSDLLMHIHDEKQRQASGIDAVDCYVCQGNRQDPCAMCSHKFR